MDIGATGANSAIKKSESFVAGTPSGVYDGDLTTFTLLKGYTDGYVDVFREGMKLGPTEYSAVDSATIVLALPAVAGDIIDVQAFGNFNVAEHYTKPEANALLDTKADLGGSAANTFKVGFGVLADEAVQRVQLDTKADLSYVDAKPTGRKNLLINGGFDIWQRGEGFTSVAGKYHADRFGNGSGFIDATKSTMLLNGTNVNSILLTNSSTTNSTQLRGNVELQSLTSISPFIPNKEYTVSFYVQVQEDSAIDVGLFWGHGLVATTSIDVIKTTSLLNGVVTKVEQTFTINTLPDGINDTSLVFFIDSKASVSNLNITQVQLEQGSVATPFEILPIGETLSLCQRYYEVGNIVFSSATSDNDRIIQMFQYKQSKRVLPTIVVTSIPGTVELRDIFDDSARLDNTQVGTQSQATLTIDAEIY